MASALDVRLSTVRGRTAATSRTVGADRIGRIFNVHYSALSLNDVVVKLCC
jgi:hypothetical protein